MNLANFGLAMCVVFLPPFIFNVGIGLISMFGL